MRMLVLKAPFIFEITIIEPRPIGHNMEWTRSGEDLFVRIDSGDEIHASLQRLADEVGFNAAAITSGIGRTRDTLYGYMNEDGVYIRRQLDSPSELVSLSGNIARKQDGTAFTHIHCCWSDDDNNVHAGHMFQCVVHVVAEIHIRILKHAIMTRCPLPDVELLGLQFS
ncbi:MAG: hypothetical protein CMB59_02040 [Euryarchaeota archaeon]|nr:hypothetical protein [Euryarchaeota archaeon]